METTLNYPRWQIILGHLCKSTIHPGPTLGVSTGGLHRASNDLHHLNLGPSLSFVPTLFLSSFCSPIQGSLKEKDTLPRKEVKVWKLKRQRRRLVIGMDVGLQDTCQRSLCALVGCFVYKTCCAIPFAEWMRSHWTSICGYVP